MRVKHLIRELQKCDPEWDVVIKSPRSLDSTYKLELGIYRVFLIPGSHADDYHTMDDTPFPLQPTSGQSASLAKDDLNIYIDRVTGEDNHYES